MKLGIIAGSRLFPIIFSQSAKRKNKDIELVAICFWGETSRSITQYVDKCFWIHVGELNKLVNIIKEEKLNTMVMAGQINPKRIFQRKHWDDKMLRLADDIKDFRPHSVFGRIIRTLEIMGVKFIDSTIYMDDFMAAEGVMNDLEPSREVWEDVHFGIKIISRFVELDIGQSIVIKNKSVVALESLEGTDNTIVRGCRIAGRGCTVLKFSKEGQDLRFDVPVVGLNTLNILKRTRASSLVLEKKNVIILEKDKFLSKARQWGISVVGKAKV
ncbi:MAG: hypothetical protein B1H08_01535 [Candidatus Omnitrophica bacterium 4484_171]|nr:MAG: hypothetical protein B1H08_01535 [Candidatus Omnitrophica bacterium 4484_171]